MTHTTSTPDEQSWGALEETPRLGNLLEEYGEITAILPILAGRLSQWIAQVQKQERDE